MSMTEFGEMICDDDFGADWEQQENLLAQLAEEEYIEHVNELIDTAIRQDREEMNDAC
jgi:hypothetical protein